MPTKRKPSRSQALARRPVMHVTLRDPKRLLAVPEPAALNTLGEEATLGALGLVEVKLTKEEETILNEPVLEREVQMKPSGQPYLSHPSYTRWFNRAFGRLGWAIVPRSKPIRAGNSVVCPYLLYIHGQPAAFAMGEQEYYESNKEQTYGDALEATVASALRRCAKRLGVGLELWDKHWLEAFVARECIMVQIKRGDEVKWVWRRRSDRPFWNELGAKQEQAADAQRRPPAEPAPRSAPPPPPAGDYEDQPISDIPRTKTNNKVGQVQRLWMIIKNSGRSEAEVKGWLETRFGIDSTKKIKRRDYDAICQWIEQRGPLPSREPGEDG